jgi:hypothetical protein
LNQAWSLADAELEVRQAPPPRQPANGVLNNPMAELRTSRIFLDQAAARAAMAGPDGTP